MPKENYALTVIIILTITVFCLLFNAFSNSENSKNIDFLKLYGWEVDKKPIEKVEIVIPEIFDEVYLNYNELQIEASLDLLPYRGFSAVRFTYPVKNFPLDTDTEVFANVITVDGEPVAGDICSYAIDGFMYSLNFNTQNCFYTSLMDEYF